MKNKYQLTQRDNIRSFVQEVHQALAEWVNQLPFIKAEIPREPGPKDEEEKTDDGGEGNQPTDRTMAGPLSDGQP